MFSVCCLVSSFVFWFLKAGTQSFAPSAISGSKAFRPRLPRRSSERMRVLVRVILIDLDLTESRLRNPLASFRVVRAVCGSPWLFSFIINLRPLTGNLTAPHGSNAHDRSSLPRASRVHGSKCNVHMPPIKGSAITSPLHKSNDPK